MASDRRPALAGLVRRLRLRAGLTQEELAQRTGLTPNTIGVLERGKRRRLYPRTVRVLADALGLDATERAELIELAHEPSRAEAVPAPAPPARPETTRAPLTNLPAPLSSFVGRERELTAAGLFVAQGVRLLTLTGTGGVGKTRLAIEGARAVQRHFPSGVWFVDLAPVTAAQVPQAVATVLGVRDAPELSLTQGIVAALRERTSLLMLDNCEHVVDACAELTALVLRQCPAVTIIATSREALAVTGEQVYHVPPMALPPADWAPASAEPAALIELTQFAAVKLFVDRARAVRPDFALTAESAAALVAVCRRLDGLPLAIELAAARMRVLSPAQLTARLDDRFRTLMRGARDVPPQHQTLRALIDWSHDLLATPERVLVRRLSVFAGGFSLEAAEAISSPESRIVSPASGGQDSTVDAGLTILDSLTALVDKSLVAVESREDTARYYLLESIREYAWEKLTAAGEVDAIRSLHAAHYLELAERIAPELRGRRQIAWLRHLDMEHNNLRAALARAGEIGDAGLSARLCLALAQFWHSRGYLAEGRAWIAAVLGSESISGLSAVLRSKLLLGAGQLALWLELAESIQLLTEAVALSRAQKAQEVLAESLIWLGTTLRRQRDFASARMAIEEGMALSQSLDNTACLALGELMLGMTQANDDDIAGATYWMAQALDHFLTVDDPRWIANTRVLYGGCLLESGGDLTDAGRVLHAGLLGLRELGERPFMMTGLLWLARLVVMIPDPVRAARLLGAADALSASLGAAWTQSVADMEESVLSPIRVQLDERSIAAARAEGRRLSLEDALAEADTVGLYVSPA